MHNRPLAERLLSLAIGTPRASALYGDLEELSPTRGRLWFGLAYTRTLLPFAGNVALSILALVIPFRYAGQIGDAIISSMHWLFGWLAGYVPGFHLSFWFFPLANSIVGLFSLLPFVLARFGLRDRLAQLTCVIFLTSLPLFSFRPLAIELVGVVTAVAVLAALCIRQWRRPMVILILTLAAQYAFMRTLLLPTWIRPHPSKPLYLLDLCLTAFLCIILHRRLLQRDSPRGSTLPA